MGMRNHDASASGSRLASLNLAYGCFLDGLADTFSARCSGAYPLADSNSQILNTLAIDLLQSHCDPTEFIAVLIHHFGRYQTDSETKVIFTDPEDGGTLTVSLTKRDRIEVSGKLSSARQSAIRRDVRRVLIDDQKLCIAEVVAYSGKPVVGYFVLADHFQVLPIPSGHLRAGHGYGSQNPFRLRFRYTGSADFGIDGTRWHRQALRYATLLNAFLDTNIQVGPSWPESGWLVNGHDQPSSWHQLGFTFPGQNGKPGEWLDTSELTECEVVPSADYYSTHAPFDGVLRVPSDLRESLSAALALTDESLVRFTRVARWLYQVPGLWRHSQSAAFVALVSALETLVEPAEPQPCNGCGQPVFQISKRFKLFLETHVPGLAAEPRLRDTLYRVRSSLVHGSRLLQRDLEPFRGVLDLRLRGEAMLHAKLELITTIAIHSWIHGQPHEIPLRPNSGPPIGAVPPADSGALG